LSEHELSLLKDLDASMYALATLNLSLVHPSSQSTLTARQPTLMEPPVTATSMDVSLSRDVDSSAYKIATIDLSLIHPSDGPRAQVSAASDDSAIREGSVSDSAIEVSRDRRLSMESDTGSKRRTRSSPSYVEPANGHSRQESEISVSSFGSILYGGVSDPFGYKYGEVSELPSVANTSKASLQHGHNDSIASIPSISSYGQIIKGGHRNPFGYAASFKTTHSHDASGDFDNSAATYPDNSVGPNSQESVRRHKAHKSTDSDHSTFYFRSKEPPPPLPLPPLPETYNAHKRDESTTSLAPPVSLHNSFRRHTRSRASNDSGSSIAHAYSNYGANGGRAIWAKHQSDASVDSLSSDFSAVAVARPGLGDKMFSSAANYRGAPLTSILASPNASDVDTSEDQEHFNKSDSMMDPHRLSSDSDAFLKPSDASDASIFRDQVPQSASSRGLLFSENVGNQRRPLSAFSSTSMSSSANGRDDDTMISMLGGGHVSRKAVVESFSASPCFKSKPRKKRPTFQVKLDHATSRSTALSQQEPSDSCNQNNLLASQPSSTFGKRRMALASQGLLERHSLEDTVLSGDGSDNSSMGTLFRNFPAVLQPVHR
jgi:serine/arginine repetitive matrix protein 2